MGWTFEYGYCLEKNIGENGLLEEEISQIEDVVKASLNKLEDGHSTGDPGFLALPYTSDAAKKCHRWAIEAREKFDTFVLLGIGGSALGPRAIVDILRHPFHNLLADGHRIGMRMFVYDNVDPVVFGGLLDVIDLKRTVFNVVSKSGGTAESIAPFLVIRRMLEDKLGASAKEHIVVTTDPEKGELRKLCRQEGFESFDVPASVGGRYSVLSSVGLLPAAASGVGPEALLHGARWADEQCRNPNIRENPAAMIAMLAYLFHVRRHRNILVMMPYKNGLLTFAEWFQQIWAESLGKRFDIDGKEVFAGSTPVRALGATDQHSQLQMYMEGPQDKFIIFLRVEKAAQVIQIPNFYPDYEPFAYLSGHTIGELLRLEHRATAAALARCGRPNITISLDKTDTCTLGALFHLFETATAIAGDLYRVNPYDQPGVELGKKLTYGMIGREGCQAEETTPKYPWDFRRDGP